MNIKAERVGECVRRGGRALEVRTDDQLVRHFGVTFHIEFAQRGRGLLHLPQAHFVERNVDLSLQPVLLVV